MEFDAKRLLSLSGIKADEKQTLTESVDQDLLVEAQIRQVIRSEIEAIVREAQESGDSAWILRSMKKPKNSQAGSVTMGMFGVGFASSK